MMKSSSISSEMFVYFGIIAIMIVVQGSDGQEPACLTVFGTQGDCISFFLCDHIYKLVLASISMPITMDEVQIIKDSQCGYDVDKNIPKVCCLRGNQERRNPIPNPVPNPPPVVRNHPNLRLLDKKYCGQYIEGKITGGTKTGLLEFPWMALIAYIVGRNRTEFKCGGTLINKRYVLTAAHCVTGLKSEVVLAGVRVGDHNLKTEMDCIVENGVPNYCAEKYQNFFIEYFHFHSGYDKNSHQNDIALIRLNGDANFEANNVKPICLPYGNWSTPKSKKATVTGWGKTMTHDMSEILLKANLDIVPNDVCAMFYRMKYRVSITQNQFCASGKNWMDSCAGDSGGPIQYREIIHDQVKFVQYGIVSFGSQKCGTPEYPGVYTKVGNYMDWILETIVE